MKRGRSVKLCKILGAHCSLNAYFSGDDPPQGMNIGLFLLLTQV